NNSFESPDTGSSGFSTSITSWSGVGNFGVYSPVSPTQYANDGSNGLPVGSIVPDGKQAAYISGAGAIFQTLSAVLQVGTYTLTFYAGHRADPGFNFGSGVVVGIGAGGVILVNAPVADPGAGKWALGTLTDVVTAGDA